MMSNLLDDATNNDSCEIIFRFIRLYYSASVSKNNQSSSQLRSFSCSRADTAEEQTKAPHKSRESTDGRVCLLAAGRVITSSH